MIKAIIESPYAGDIETNVEYARACVRDSLRRGEAPLASHLLYTQPGILNDDDPQERQLGIDAGLEWLAAADKHVFYVDRKLSRGMAFALSKAKETGANVEVRKLGGKWEQSQYETLCEYFKANDVIPFYKVFDKGVRLPFGFCSNFSDDSFKDEFGIFYATSEHYYQAQKFKFCSPDYLAVVGAETPRKAADIGRDNTRIINPNWDEIKVAVMVKALTLKFDQNPEIKGKLVETKGKYLVEDSPIDSYWGCGADRKGYNYLGRCLMAVRAGYVGQEKAIDFQYLPEYKPDTPLTKNPLTIES